MSWLPKGRRPAVPPAIEREAGDWIGRCDAGLTPKEARELERWLGADPRHTAAFSRLESTAHALDQLRSFRPVEVVPPDPDLPLLHRPLAIFHLARRFGLAGLAVAASIALLLFSPDRAPRDPAPHQMFATGIGELRKVTLPDGSVLDLNTDSAVTLAYDSVGRHVELTRGEAHFAVAPDSARPFVVQAGIVRVRAVGTAFSVRLRTESVEVLVTEGSVRVDDRQREASLLPVISPAVWPLLEAGQWAVIAATPQQEKRLAPAVVANVTPVEIAQRLAWQEKRLEFGPMPLREVVAEFNRYSELQLVVLDPETAGISVGGSFRAGDWQTLVRLLESNFDVRTERRGQEILLSRR